jgi:23S rRNA pseudouridine955/2504/2580 synthase
MTRNRRADGPRPARRPFEIERLWEGPDALVVNKPAGLSAHGGARVGRNLVDELKFSLGREVFPVHRLDRDTSGAMLLALTPDSARKWGEKLEAGEKKYLVISKGRFRGERFEVDSPVSHNGRTFPARTGFKVVRAFGEFTLLEARLHTGRTHQIRLHLAGIGKPVLGDDKYGDFDLNKAWAKRLHRERLYLHSAELKLAGLHVFAPVPVWFPELWKIYSATVKHPAVPTAKSKVPATAEPIEADPPHDEEELS